MIGGYDSFGEGGYAKSPYDRMLPVEMNAGDTHADQTPTPVKVTAEGLRHPIMQLVPDPARNAELWERLNGLGGAGDRPQPAFQGYSKTTRAKPAATTLAVIAGEDEGYFGPMVFLAVQPFGRGRSLAFTSDCTGAWGAVWEDSWGEDPEDPSRRNLYYKTFWKNAVRWLAHNRLQAPNQLVQIETERLAYGRSEAIPVRVKVLSGDCEPTHEARVLLTLSGPDGVKRQLPVFPRYEEPGLYERNLELRSMGRHEIEASAWLKDEELGHDKTVIQIRPAAEELRRPYQDAQALTRLAQASGGAYRTLDGALGLPALLKKDTHLVQRFRDHDLWDRPWVFLLMIALFCGEWYVRKRHGLP
jgi:hypothetical protein